MSDIVERLRREAAIQAEANRVYVEFDGDTQTRWFGLSEAADEIEVGRQAYAGLAADNAKLREELTRLREGVEGEEPVLYTSSIEEGAMAGFANKPIGRCTIPLYARPQPSGEMSKGSSA